MKHAYLPVLLGTFLGALAGVAFMNMQHASLPYMNFWGVVSMTALGTSFGCLMADPTQMGW